MKHFGSLTSAALSLLLSVSVLASTKTPKELAILATGDDGEAAAAAIRELRSMRQPGLDALLTQHATEIARYSAGGNATEEWKRIAAAIDAVAMQKDAYASGLFWHTDLEEAKKHARAEDKPILSLRLLGNLNEEFSCANSRLFRALLYPNSAISKFLRENYVLHWKSVRPAPRITIDFGDGRRIERTVTGNSIHYILDEDGGIIDALPGLYSPKGFLIYLSAGRAVAQELDRLAEPAKERAAMRYRKLSFDKIKTRREKAVALAKVKLSEPATNGIVAIAVAPLAMTKMAVTDEISLLRVYDDFARFEPQIDLSAWNKLARIYSPSQEVDQNSINFIRRQNRDTGLWESDFAALFAKLDNFIALDTTRNDFLFHLKLHQLLNDRRDTDLETFNSRVYAEIFKTPDSDKWLGLYSNDIYTALDGNGLVK